MKIYSFPILYREYNHLVDQMLSSGELSSNQVLIKLPDDFNFGSLTSPKEVDSKIINNKIILKPKEISQAVVEKYAPQFKEWPVLLKPLKLMAKEQDKGLGDIVLRIIGDENSDKFKKWYFNSFGHDCGCSSRQSWLNRKYPL